MKKKVLSIFTALIMTFSLTACSVVNAAVEDNDKWKENTGTINLDTMQVSGNGVSTADNTVNITSGGDFEVTGTLDDGMIYIKALDEKVKLRLSGASITNSKGPAIFFDDVDKGFITITEDTENFLTDAKEYTVEDVDAALFSNDDLEIKGNGTLTIKGNYKHGIAGDDDVSIENGKIIINSYEHGIKANDTLTVSGGDITVTSETGKGMKADLEVNIKDGNIDVTSIESEGIESKGTLTISGGNIQITAADDGINTGNADADNSRENFAPDQNKQPPEEMGKDRNEQSFEGMRNDFPPDRNGELSAEMRNDFPPDRNGQPPEGMKNGFPPDRNGQQRDGGMPQGGGMPGGRTMDEETAAAHALTITGGTIYVKADGDGIDSNGSLTISGGNVTVNGPERNGNGPLDSDGPMSITGGTVILASSAGMLQLPDNDGQNIMTVYFDQQQSAGTEVSIKETSTGNEIISHTSEKTFEAFVYSSDKISAGTQYTVYVNGEEYKSVTAEQVTTTVGTPNRGQGNRGGFGRFMKENNNTGISVTVNGQNVNFNTAPVMKNNTTLVGFRPILEALGATVKWDEATKSVTAEKDGTSIVLQIGSSKAYVNDEEKTLLIAPEIIDGSTMIPVRFVSEQLNMDVTWNGETQSIAIKQ